MEKLRKALEQIPSSVNSDFTAVEGAQQSKMETEPSTQGNPQPVQKSDATLDIQLSDLDDIICAMQEYYNAIQSMSQPDIDQVKALLDHVTRCRKTVIMRIRLIPHITRLSNAIETRERQLNTPSVDMRSQPSTSSLPNTIVNRQEANGLVRFSHLYQFQSDMNQQIINESTIQITPAAQKQLKTYNEIGVIEKVNRTVRQHLPYYELFVHTPLVCSFLRKDQCNVIIQNINPSKNITHREFPQFNPDFHFPCTIIGVHLAQIFEYQTNFDGTHKDSQLNLESNKGLTLHEIEGRFAFTQGSRWIQLTFDDGLNIEWNERIAFTIVNGVTPNRLNTHESTRAFCSRCMNVGAWDGKNTYFHCPNIHKMGQALKALRTLSIHLCIGTFKVTILAPKAIQVNITQMPLPLNYEHKMSLQNSWCNLTRRQLVKHLQDKFTPCIMFGSVYLPNYSDTNFGVTGKSINMMTRFANTIPENEQQDLFSWSIQEGSWIKNSSSTFSARDTYLDHDVPSQEQQQAKFENEKKYITQQIDLQQQRVYGSNHFWTWYRRNKDHNQISVEPMSANGDFTKGENPYAPLLSKSNVLDRLLISRDLSDINSQTCYTMYLDDETKRNLELSMRYRRAQFVLGYNAPSLYYRDIGNKAMQTTRIPSIAEFVSQPINQADLDVLRKLNLNKFEWIPKALVPHLDEQNGRCLSKREMAYLRLERVNKEAEDTRSSQKQAKWQNARSTFSQRFSTIWSNSHAVTPKQPAAYRFESQPDLSKTRIFRDAHLLPVSKFNIESALYNYHALRQHHQVLLKTDNISPLMEWDIEEMLARACTIKTRVAALRDYHLLYLANQFLIDIELDNNLLKIIEELVNWNGVEVFIVHENHQLAFPHGYDTYSIQYGINFARISIHQAGTSNVLKWFVSPRMDQPEMRTHFPTPGFQLGTQYVPSIFYMYEPLTEQYHADRTQPPTVHGHSQVAMQHRRRQATYLTMMAHTFVEFNRFSNNPSMIHQAQKIKCPQESRLFLRHNFMSNSTNKMLHSNTARRPSEPQDERKGRRISTTRSQKITRRSKQNKNINKQMKIQNRRRMHKHQKANQIIQSLE